MQVISEIRTIAWRSFRAGKNPTLPKVLNLKVTCSINGNNGLYLNYRHLSKQLTKYGKGGLKLHGTRSGMKWEAWNCSPKNSDKASDDST